MNLKNPISGDSRSLPFLVAVLAVATGLFQSPSTAAEVKAPAGFTPLFNGKDLTGWYGLNADPRKIFNMSEQERAKFRQDSMADVRKHWTVEGDELVNDGHGAYLTTEKDFGDYELLIDYKTVPKADSGIYLRGVPQVQIWDHTNAAEKKNGADKGSGALWNNSPDAPGRFPPVVADKPFGEWNKFRIIQIGARTTVFLNDKLVVDNAIMENYWDRKKPLWKKGPIQLQTHGGEIRWRNVFIREIPSAEANAFLMKKGNEGFKAAFNGQNLDGWSGPVADYEIKDGVLICKPGKGGTIYTKEEYADFVARFEFKLPPGGNSGLAIRYPGQGDTAYVGMCELQVLDDTSEKYKNLDPRQFHGSAYGMAAPERGFLRPVGEWNFQEVTVQGSRIKVELNGTVILDADLSKVNDYLADKAHPGKDRTTGHFGFAGHNDPVAFRNVAIKKL